MEIAPGVHRLRVPYQDRYLYQHLLVGDENVLVVDAGIDSTPDTALRPYLQRLGIGRDQRLFLLLTHSDADHCGGAANMRRLFPNAVTLCHKLEADRIADPERNLSERYDEFREADVAFSDERLARLRSKLGAGCPVDVRLDGTEEIRLSVAWRVQLLFTPGHTPGHLAVHDPRDSLTVVADAALASGIPTTDGDVAFAPTYRHTEAYLHTIQQLSELGAQRFLTSHFPEIAGVDAIAAFLDDSRGFVQRVRDYIRGAVEQDEEVTLKGLIEGAYDHLGGWPPERNLDLCYCLQGGLEALEAESAVRSMPGRPTVWKRVPDGARQS